MVMLLSCFSTGRKRDRSYRGSNTVLRILFNGGFILSLDSQHEVTLLGKED